MPDAVIVEAVRTPIGKKKGKLSGTRPDDLVAETIKELVKRAGIDPAEIEDVVMGCVTQVGEQGFNIARNAALIAGFPIEVTGTSVNRQCGSSQQAIHFAAQGVMAGVQDCVLAAGVESMNRLPMGEDGKIAGFPVSPKLSEKYLIVPQGISAEMIAEKWKLTRKDVDEFGLESNEKALRAIDEGRFKREIMPVEIQDNGAKVMFDTDEGPRRGTSLEKMGTLVPAFKQDGIVTAGNSSQICDGAAAVLIMSEKKAKELGLKPRARIVSMALAGVDPTIMLTGPIPSTEKALKKANMKLSDIDIFEINEAFATVVLAWEKELKPDHKKVNVNGGAIAIGHPLGCSGARLMTTLLHELERQDKKYGLQTMCIGFGQGIATIIEKLN